MIFHTLNHTSLHEIYLVKLKRFQLKLGPPTLQRRIILASVHNTCPCPSLLFRDGNFSASSQEITLKRNSLYIHNQSTIQIHSREYIALYRNGCVIVRLTCVHRLVPEAQTNCNFNQFGRVYNHQAQSAVQVNIYHCPREKEFPWILT